MAFQESLYSLEDTSNVYKFPSTLAISSFYYSEIFANLIHGKFLPLLCLSEDLAAVKAFMEIICDWSHEYSPAPVLPPHLI